METLNNLVMGFSIVLEPKTLLFCALGVTIGTVVGLLPGIGPTGAIAILLPVTYNLSPVAGIILLAGIYYGAMYGGTITSVLLSIPGEASTVVTCLDGHQMARKGLAGPALGIAAFGSFIAGTFSVVILMLLAPVLAEFALLFGPPQYFALMFVALIIVSYLGEASFHKSMIVILLGLVAGSVGVDLETGRERLTFGIPSLYEGLDIAAVMMGVFGVGEILINIEKGASGGALVTRKIEGYLPTRQHWKEAALPIARGSGLGFFLGLIPGGGAVIASFVAYIVEKRISKHPEKFGTGVIEGVAAPESANNSATAGAFVSLLALGIPGNAIMALMIGALLVHGVQPSPLLIERHPEVFWGLICSMYIGNLILLVLNLPLIPIWIQLLRVRPSILFPIVLLITVLGAYSLTTSADAVVVMLVFGVLGYLMKKCGFDAAPFAMAFVLAPMIEQAMRQSLLMSRGSYSIFFADAISASMMGVAFLLLLTRAIPKVRRAAGKLKLQIPQSDD